MKIRLIKWSYVLLACASDKKMLKAFEDFRCRLKFAEGCKTPAGLVKDFQNSDLITCKKTKQSRIVFKIGNNKYRLICGYLFKLNTSVLFVKFVGSHIEYDKVDACQVNMFK